ncbi:hypothetical protein BTHI11S_01841 [Bosea thiooxidans]
MSFTALETRIKVEAGKISLSVSVHFRAIDDRPLLALL